MAGKLKGQKRNRSSHSLATKLEIVRRGESGQMRSEISQAMGIAGSTIYTVLKNADVIKAMAKKAVLQKVLAEKINSAAFTTPKHKGAEITKANKKAHSAKETGKKPLSLKTKLEVLRRFKRGEMPTYISQALKIRKIIVFDIIKSASKIKALAAEKAAAYNALANKTNMAIIQKNNWKDTLVDEQKQHKRRTPHPLATRLEVVRRFENGETKVQIGRDMGLPKSTVFAITVNARKIKAEAMMAAAQEARARKVNDSKKAATQEARARKVNDSKKAAIQEASVRKVNGATENSKDIVMENMERLLKIWIDEQLSHPDALTDETIQRKALSLWKFVWDSLGPEETTGLVSNFTASTAWLEQFKEGIGLHSVPLTFAKPRAVSSQLSSVSEVKAVAPVQRRVGVPKGISSLLRAKIEVGGYTPSQVINLDEVGLFWKKPLTSTIISLDDKVFQGAREQFSLMLGANATGDLKLKPLLAYHVENPRSLRGYIKEYLPVIWRSHPRGRVVPSLCQNYVVDYISQRCKEYAMKHNLQNKFLLLVDNGPAYPPSMDDWADNIEVMFVPTMTKSVVQPMEHGITTAFKLCYFYRFLEQLIRETDREDKESLRHFWLNYDIKKAVNNIKMAWDDVTPSTLNAAWQSIWPECVHESHSRASPCEPTELEVLDLAHQAGFLQVTVEDIQELIQTPSEEMTTEEPHQVELNQVLQEHEEPEKEVVRTLDITLLHHVLNLFDEAMAVLEDNDPNCTRSCDARNFVERGIKCYRELYATKRKKAQNTSIFYPHN